jgi:signal transduction histidine kinase
MAKSQTVSRHLKGRMATGILIFWGSVIVSIAAILIEYLSTHHFVLLVAVFALVVPCAISVIMLFFILSVLRCLDMLELWMNNASRSAVVQPVLDAPYLDKSTESFFQAWNALVTRLRSRSNRRVQFVERYAHDMRSSLASIQGYAEVLIDYHIGIEGASLQSYGKIIATQTQRLAKMIEDAETATCIAEGRLRLEHEPFNLSSLINAVISEARGKNVREIKYQNDLGEYIITGDSFRLREVIRKLVDSAFSLSTSCIFIHVQLDHDQSERWVKITVEDHDKVLSEPELTALFQPFDLPKENKISSIFQNSVNFYIIKATVEGHNGRVTVQSQPGRGTTYTVFLPVQKVNE